jgi:hypothetical protein
LIVPSGRTTTLDGVTRIILIPAPTADGRAVVLRAVALTPAERLRRLVKRLTRR